ncbi:hypothetical protein EYF80_038731 [Liparis tanakae]|uniref:Uncharacterized protein n=1 Tax=Liparis tanakae TaxID=230148 RepID=A0A4Z2GCR8_9TELE|nr:hypothetical protein EYF80_038731 [Liparis tanakae]
MESDSRQIAGARSPPSDSEQLIGINPFGPDRAVTPLTSQQADPTAAWYGVTLGIMFVSLTKQQPFSARGLRSILGRAEQHTWRRIERKLLRVLKVRRRPPPSPLLPMQNARVSLVFSRFLKVIIGCHCEEL